MKRCILLTAFFSMLLIVSCVDPKQGAINDLNGIYEELSINSENYTDEDWQIILQEYSENDSILTSYLRAGEYTRDEQQQIADLQGRCAAIFLDHQIGGAGKELFDYMKNVGSFVNGLLDEFTK